MTSETPLPAASRGTALLLPGEGSVTRGSTNAWSPPVAPAAELSVSRRPSADTRDDEPEWLTIILSALLALGVGLTVLALVDLVYGLVA